MNHDRALGTAHAQHIRHGDGTTVGLGEWLIENMLRPRGKAIPPGHHLAHEGGFSRSWVPEPHVIIKFPLYTADLEPLGSFVAVADKSTRYIVDGAEVSMDSAMAGYGQYHGFMRLTVDEPGHLAVFEYDTRDSSHA